MNAYVESVEIVKKFLVKLTEMVFGDASWCLDIGIGLDLSIPFDGFI